MVVYNNIIISIIPLTLHCFGCFLLYTKSINLNSSQKIFLLNLSFSEILLCGVGILYLCLEEAYTDQSRHCARVMILYISLFLTYWLIMIALTISRFTEVYLNIRLALYWSTIRTKRLMATFWVISILNMIIANIYFEVIDNRVSIIDAYYSKNFQVLNVTFIITALFTYGYIVSKMLKNLKKNRLNSRVSGREKNVSINENQMDNNKDNITNVSQKKVYSTCKKNSLLREKSRKFLLPTLIISTYILCFALPDMLWMLVGRKIIKKGRSTLTTFAAYMTYIGFSSDAMIYIFLSTKPGRNVLQKLFKSKKNTNDSSG